MYKICCLIRALKICRGQSPCDLHTTHFRKTTAAAKNLWLQTPTDVTSSSVIHLTVSAEKKCTSYSTNQNSSLASWGVQGSSLIQWIPWRVYCTNELIEDVRLRGPTTQSSSHSKPAQTQKHSAIQSFFPSLCLNYYINKNVIFVIIRLKVSAMERCVSRKHTHWSNAVWPRSWPFSHTGSHSPFFPVVCIKICEINA